MNIGTRDLITLKFEARLVQPRWDTAKCNTIAILTRLIRLLESYGLDLRELCQKEKIMY